MNRIAGFALLIALSLSWPIQAKAQSDGVAAYARNSAKADKKEAKDYRKARKKFAKDQRKSVKKANRQNANRSYRTNHPHG